MSKENARARLLENYNAEDQGTWDIFGENYGEDPSSGPHYEPKMDTVTGTYKNVVEYALTLNGFFRWGRGGRISKKLCQTKLLNVDTLSNPKVVILQDEKLKLQTRLEQIEQELFSLTEQ